MEADWTTLRTRELLPELSQAGLGISGVYHFFDFPAEPRPPESGFLVDEAVFWNAKTLLVVPGFLETTEGPAYEEGRLRMLEGLSHLCDLAQPKGLRVTLEDFDDLRAPYSTPQELLWFLTREPRLRCTFDTGNFALRNIAELDAFDSLKHKIVHVHCKDRSLDGTMACCALGDGRVPLAALVDRLLAQHYHGDLVIEHFGVADQLAAMERSAHWLRQSIRNGRDARPLRFV